jgi:hypothetical protein
MEGARLTIMGPLMEERAKPVPPRPQPTSKESVALQEAEGSGRCFVQYREGGVEAGEFVIHFLDAEDGSPRAEKLAVGSHDDCDLVLGWDETVDSSHAVFERVGPDWYLDDKKSTNGTQVYRASYVFSADDEFWLHDEDVIRMGNTLLVFRGPTSEIATRSTEHPSDLTRGERAVALELIAFLIDGNSEEVPSNLLIGDRLNVSEETVKSTMTGLFRKYEIPKGKPGNKRRALAEEIISRGSLDDARL